jgi:hypothetical protein
MDGRFSETVCGLVVNNRLWFEKRATDYYPLGWEEKV